MNDLNTVKSNKGNNLFNIYFFVHIKYPYSSYLSTNYKGIKQRFADSTNQVHLYTLQDAVDRVINHDDYDHRAIK